jgi:hypothetical protein
MNEEPRALEKKKMKHGLLYLSQRIKIAGYKWVDKIKYNSNCPIKWYQDILLTKEYPHAYRIDYHVRILIGIENSYQLRM